MINITFCSQEWDDSALWLKAGSWKLWIWNPVTEVSVTEYHYFTCSVQTLRLAMPSFSSNLQTILLLPEKKKTVIFPSFNLESVDEIFLMETQSWTAFFCGTDYYAPQDVLWLKSWIVTIKMKATERHFPVVLIIVLCTAAVMFESVGGIPKGNHFHESFCEALSWGIVYYS